MHESVASEIRGRKKSEGLLHGYESGLMAREGVGGLELLFERCLRATGIEKQRVLCGGTILIV